MPKRFDAQSLTNSCAEALTLSGVPETDASQVALSLVLADARGLSSHGVSRMAIYLASIKNGVMVPDAELEVVRSSPATLVLDAQNGLGVPSALTAMDMVIEKAGNLGVGFAAIRRSNHFGMAGHIADHAAQSGLLGYAATNGPSRMAPFGGSVPVFGTSPFAYAIPTGSENPILIDMATCVVARGKIIMAERAGEDIPEGWAVDSDGRSTTDPKLALAGSVLPFAGPKGSALAMLVEILTGILGGDSWAQGVGDLYKEDGQPTGTSHCVAALDIETMIGREDFNNNLADLISQMKLSAPSDSAQVLLPGERELTAQAHTWATGIPLEDNIVDELSTIFGRYGMSAPRPIS